MWMVRKAWFVAFSLVAILAVSGCQGSSDSSRAGGDGPSNGWEQDGEDADQRFGGVAGEQPDDARAIIYTGRIAVQVTDVDQAAADAAAVATRYGGYLSAEHRSSAANDEAHASIQLRVASEHFPEALAALAALGEELYRDISSEDVTEEVVDLQTRLDGARASVERTRELMERAESIEDIVAVEGELTKREQELAALQARQRELTDQTALSTITVELVEQQESLAPSEPRDLGFVVGLRSGWRLFTNSMTVLVTLFGLALPWTVAGGVPAIATIWWVRRRRRTTA